MTTSKLNRDIIALLISENNRKLWVNEPGNSICVNADGINTDILVGPAVLVNMI